MLVAMKAPVLDQMKNLGERIKEIRTRAKLTQAQLARESEEHQSIISAVERGDRRPTIEFLVWYSERFRVTLDYLVFGNGTPQGEAPCHCPKESKMVPLLEGAPGPVGLITEYAARGALCIPQRVAKSEDEVAVIVNGDSNQPTIKNGAIIGVDRGDRRLVSGYWYNFKLPSGYLTGRAYLTNEQLIIRKADPQHPEITINLADIEEDCVVGRVKWVMQEL